MAEVSSGVPKLAGARFIRCSARSRMEIHNNSSDLAAYGARVSERGRPERCGSGSRLFSLISRVEPQLKPRAQTPIQFPYT